MTDGQIKVFNWPISNQLSILNNLNLLGPRLKKIDQIQYGLITRGFTVHNNNLICGAFFREKTKRKMLWSRLITFDLEKHEKLYEHILPSYQSIKRPEIYAMEIVGDELEQTLDKKKDVKFFKNNKEFTPIKEQINSNLDSKEITNSNKSDTTKIKKEKNRKFNNRINRDNNEADKKKKKTIKNGHPKYKKVQNLAASKPPICDEISRTEIINIPKKIDDKKPTIILNNVGLRFSKSKRSNSFFKRLKKSKYFWALRQISLTIFEGETLGIIGRNGSGKSTLTMICGKVLVPDEGEVIVNGRVQLLALGVGFKAEMSGRENIYISGSLMGLSKRQIDEQMNDIESFAELGEYIDEPVKTYSSGMRSRLGFAVATAVRPDLLILDEIMATGDKAFRDKAMQRMNEMQSLARSVIVVSHNPGQLRKLSTRVLWMEKGRKIMLGDPTMVLNSYNEFCKDPERWIEKHSKFNEEEGRIATR